MLLECCVDCLESALTADQNGADRLELCANLLIGGSTPSLSLLHQVKRQVKAKVNVLLRPRFGDFCYSAGELDQLAEDCARYGDEGADGLVIGVLTPEGQVDEAAMERLMKAAGGLPVTFHRAFDVARDPFEALESCRRLGVSTILTSGQKASALEGLPLLTQLVQRQGELTIMVGSGVNPGNLPQLLSSGASAYHMSAKKVVDSPMTYRKEGVPMGLPMMSEFSLWRCDGEQVAQARAILDREGKN